MSITVAIVIFAMIIFSVETTERQLFSFDALFLNKII